MLAAVPGYAGGMTFTDINESDWFHPYITELAVKNLTKGYADGTYRPDRLIQIDEFLAFALRTIGLDLPNAEPYWAQYYITNALQLNLIEPGEFDQYDVPITREKMAEIVVILSGVKINGSDNYSSVFTDISRSQKRQYIMKAVELGVLAGYEDKTFRPANSATRAEAATIVLRMIDKDYRIERYGDIVFVPAADLNEDGMLKVDKSHEFNKEVMKDLHIGISENSTAVITGTIPQVPDGLFVNLMISFFNDKGRYLTFYSTKIESDDLRLPKSGYFDVDTNVGIDDIAYITIVIGIPTGTSMDDMKSPLVTYELFKYYHKNKEGLFYIDVDGVPGSLKMEFDLTDGIWGW